MKYNVNIIRIITKYILNRVLNQEVVTQKKKISYQQFEQLLEKLETDIKNTFWLERTKILM